MTRRVHSLQYDCGYIVLMMYQRLLCGAADPDYLVKGMVAEMSIITTCCTLTSATSALLLFVVALKLLKSICVVLV